MLKRTLFVISIIGSAIGTSAGVVAADFGTAEDAKAMLSRAIAELKADARGAIERFNHNDPRFRDRDLFVFCFGRDGRFTAHEAFVSQDVRTFHDPNGKPVGAEMYNGAREGQITEVDFASPVPGSAKPVAKRAFVTRVGDQVCGVSAYELSGASTH
jgi:hypothetical protein